MIIMIKWILIKNVVVLKEKYIHDNDDNDYEVNGIYSIGYANNYDDVDNYNDDFCIDFAESDYNINIDVYYEVFLTWNYSH